MDADELRLRMATLPEPVTEKQPPYWEAWRLDLWQQAQQHARFWEYPCVYHCMLVQHWIDAITYEWQELDKNRFAGVNYLQGVLEVGEGSFRENFFISPLTNNLIHQAYHLQQWEQTTGQRVEELSSIVEFGGGYGAMRLLIHELGFRGRYTIYDLPEFSLLQEYYLSQYDVKTEWNPRRKPKNVDLFMALYSISEVPPEQRNKYLSGFMSFPKSYLFLYSGQWQDWDNVGWIRQFAMSTVLEWKHSEIEHLPDRNNWYSIGY